MKALLVCAAAVVALCFKSEVDTLFWALMATVLVSSIVVTNQLDKDEQRDKKRNRSVRD